MYISSHSFSFATSDYQAKANYKGFGGCRLVAQMPKYADAFFRWMFHGGFVIL